MKLKSVADLEWKLPPATFLPADSLTLQAAIQIQLRVFFQIFLS